MIGRVKIMLSFVGGYTEEIINFPNGMCVKIDFGNSKLSFFTIFSNFYFLNIIPYITV